MNGIKDKWVATPHGTRKFLDWVDNGPYRCLTSFDESSQLKMAIRIASVEDADARNLASELLREATYLHNQLIERQAEWVQLKSVIDAILMSEKEAT